ncbi:MAG: AMP-binding enzyme [Hyperionvirus sp.]|uniref:AMP-binding enzyme n=1 Tax=Hyperionvirus sp. TaxID=2487770 RepID=A0A3G5A8H4_9VIRU|nr:MAG: AMP-binding enzyme [Hyperionvirus sp.]
MDFGEEEDLFEWSLMEYIVILVILIILGCIIFKLCRSRNSLVVVEEELNLEGKTILEALRFVAKNYPDRVALVMKKNNGTWSEISYRDYFRNVRRFANGLKYWMGGGGVSVGILGCGGPAWFYAHLGCLLNLGVSKGVTEVSKGALGDIDVLVVGDFKIAPEDIPGNIKLILYYSPIEDDVIKKFSIPVVSFGAFMDSMDGVKIKKTRSVGEDDLVGEGVSHRDISVAVGSIVANLAGVIRRGERFLSCGPLDSIKGQILDIYLPIYNVGTVWFAGVQVLTSLIEVRPSIFMGSAAVLAAMREKIESSYIYSTLPRLMSNKILNTVGLNKCKLIVLTTEDTNIELKQFYNLLGLKLTEILV